ncbi:MAG: hypothetical protein V7731_22985 [Amphritea sp.]
MKTRRLIDKLKHFFDADLRAQQEQRESLKEVLDKLKSKEHELKDRLEREKNPEERERLEKKITLVHTQRKKGVALLKEDSEKEKP